ncbi:MAG: PEP-CTERM sorting domain-containing protein [Bryobacteraceae bacterium]
MSKLAVIVAAFGCMLNAATINIVGTGKTVAEGSIDPNWSITSPSGSAFVTVTDGFPIAAGLWIANDANSKWIEPAGATVDTHPTNSPYTYRTTFSLAGLIASTASLTFRAAGDNEITAVRLNGNTVGFTYAAFNAFSSPFLISTAAFFNSGTNSLEFDVLNTTGDPNPTGLRVEISGTADPFSDPPPPSTPEPATVSLIAAGLGALYLKRRGR